METTKRATRWMRRLLPLCLTALLSLNSLAQIGSWKSFSSYYEPQQIVKGGNMLYVRASNGLYSYNMNDQSITTYDKVNQLNDSYITHIAWNPTAKRLIIVYQNSNIDLLDTNDNVYSISSLYTKSMTQDKTVNNVYIHDKYAYLATGFGVVKVNMERAEIAESYILLYNITNIGIDNDDIYVKTKGGNQLTAKLYNNLIDPHNWSLTNSYPDNIFNNDLTDWNENIELVKTLKPGGPKYNNFGFMKFHHNKLYTCGVGSSVERPATIQIFDGNEWTFLQDYAVGQPGTEANRWSFVNMNAVAIDPNDSKHIFGGARTGLYEYYDGEIQKYYNKDNSILKTAANNNKYVLVTSVLYDSKGSLWLLQSQVEENSIIEITSDGQWVTHPQPLLMKNGKSLNDLRALYEDSRGYLWFVNANWDTSSFYCYDPQRDEIVSYMVHAVNQDGLSINEMYRPKCIVEDLDGNIWLGTGVGLYMIEASAVGSPLEYVNQIKVPRNDGTNYADYLMADARISCMAIDGGNRKWIGTVGSGLYLVSADNMEQLENFTTANSPLLSNNIESIAINHLTGEVFIGTDQGLCSYMSDATGESIEMVKDNVYAYPNPVVAGYDGLITIKGLTRDADVKILSTSGQLVAQGRSNGGIFTWNGRDRSGKRVASGVYMVATATSDGKKGTVCKIAIVR
ncbi:MAG: Por secretion system protein [Prevotella sp.]|nr:Por secretion system protein [Prevotella sp.]